MTARHCYAVFAATLFLSGCGDAHQVGFEDPEASVDVGPGPAVFVDRVCITKDRALSGTYGYTVWWATMNRGTAPAEYHVRVATTALPGGSSDQWNAASDDTAMPGVSGGSVSIYAGRAPRHMIHLAVILGDDPGGMPSQMITVAVGGMPLAETSSTLCTSIERE